MIPFSKPDINRIDLKRVEKCIKSGWLTHGPNTKKFEKYFVISQNQNFLPQLLIVLLACI